MLPPIVARFWFAIAADLDGGPQQQGELRPQQVAALDVGERHERAEGDGIRVGVDAPQLVDPPEADELLLAERAGGQLHHQVGAAGKGTPRARRAGKQIERLVERARPGAWRTTAGRRA